MVWGGIKTHLHSNNNVKSHETPLFIATEMVGCLAWPKYKQKYSLDMDWKPTWMLLIIPVWKKKPTDIVTVKACCLECTKDNHKFSFKPPNLGECWSYRYACMCDITIGSINIEETTKTTLIKFNDKSENGVHGI